MLLDEQNERVQRHNVAYQNLNSQSSLTTNQSLDSQHLSLFEPFFLLSFFCFAVQKSQPVLCHLVVLPVFLRIQPHQKMLLGYLSFLLPVLVQAAPWSLRSGQPPAQ